MNQIPLTLQAQPASVDLQALDINQLLTVIAQNMSAFISANVSFFLQGASDPTTFQTSLIYNTSQRIFKGWDVGTGSYLPITPYVNGDMKLSFVAGDDPNNGWIVCDGRPINSVQNISANQQAVLNALFGAGGNLPIVTPVQALQGLPANGSFSSIPNPATNPPPGQIGGLPVSNPPQQTEVQAITSNTELLDVSSVALQQALISVISSSEQMLNSLNGKGATLYAKVFVGYA